MTVDVSLEVSTLKDLCVINRITMSGNYELQVDMWDWDDVYAVARYGSFEVTSESDGFRLLGRGSIFSWLHLKLEYCLRLI